MKQFFVLLTFAFGFQLAAQTHHIGLNFGVNQLLSIDEGPPFGDNSPWESTLGIGYGFSYQYAFKNKITIGLGFSKMHMRFIEPNVSKFIEELNEDVLADEFLILYSLNYNLSLGYQWNFTKRHSFQVSGGPNILYDDKQKSYLEGYEQTLFTNDFDFSKDQIYYGVNLSIKQSYTVYQDWNYRINLNATLRNTYIFDYLHRNNSIDRILPQAYLGVELELGRRRR